MTIYWQSIAIRITSKVDSLSAVGVSLRFAPTERLSARGSGYVNANAND
jgi:hypothetical protein